MAIVKRNTITTIEIDARNIDNTIFVNEIVELVDEESQETVAELENNRHVLYADTLDFPEIRDRVKKIAQKYAEIWSPQFK